MIDWLIDSVDNKFKIPIIIYEEILNAQMCRNAILYGMVWHGMIWHLLLIINPSWKSHNCIIISYSAYDMIWISHHRDWLSDPILHASRLTSHASRLTHHVHSLFIYHSLLYASDSFLTLDRVLIKSDDNFMIGSCTMISDFDWLIIFYKNKFSVQCVSYWSSNRCLYIYISKVETAGTCSVLL